MTASPSSKRVAVEVAAASLGGVYLVVLGLSLEAHLRLLTPAAYQALGLAGALLVLLALTVRADRRITALTIAFAAAAWIGLAMIRSHNLLPDAFLLAASLLMLLFTVWMHRDHLATYLVCTGAFGGALLAGLITQHDIQVAHGVILAGVVLAFLTGKRQARTKDRARAYRGMMMTVVVPCVLLLVAGLVGHTWVWDLLIGGTAVVFTGWRDVAGSETAA